MFGKADPFHTDLQEKIYVCMLTVWQPLLVWVPDVAGQCRVAQLGWWKKGAA